MEPQVLRDMPLAEYHADRLTPEPSLSSTLARLVVGRSPLHAWTQSARLNPDYVSTDRKTFDIGRAAHTAVLGRGEAFAAIPEDLLATNGAASTKEAKAFIAECRESGITPLKAAEVEQIDIMATVLREALDEMHPAITLRPEDSEVAAFAIIDGVWCRALIDNAPADPALPLIDFKSTEDASPDACIRAVVNYGYDLQAAHYLDTWHAATGERRRFQFIFQEKAPPYEVGVVELYDGRHITDLTDPARAADWWDDASEKARDARYLWRRCLDTNRWPGYPRQVAVVGAPSYYRQKWSGRPNAPERPSPDAIAAALAAQAPERTTP